MTRPASQLLTAILAPEANMPSQRKSETARANGARSKGPATSEGRARSSRNAVRHGLSAKAILVPGESEAEFRQLLDDYVEQFQPATGVEMDLVETMAAARWRLRRLTAIEAHLLDNEICRREDDIAKQFNADNLDIHDRLAFVFQKLADYGQSLAIVIRYEGALNRTFYRAFKQLQKLQNEPKPDPAPTPASPSSRPAAPPVTPPAPSTSVRSPAAPAPPVMAGAPAPPRRSRLPAKVVPLPGR